MKKRALGVIRVSKKKQASEERYSLPAQEKAIRDYCDRENIDLLEVYTEAGTSAFTADIKKIPNLSLALERIEAGDAKALIVHESSRLARTERLTSEIADRLEACGAEFINVSMGGFDYSTPEGRLILAQEAAMNSYWSRKTGEHSRKGKRQQFEEGLHIGKIPFGYQAATTLVDGVPRSTRRLPMEIVPEEAASLKKAFEDYALGKNAHQIAREWNQLGLKPRSVKALDYFQPQTVRHILRNRLYAGWIRRQDEWRKGRHEPIVTEEQYWAAQRPKADLRRRVHPPRPLRGIATCPEGHRLYVLGARHSPKDPYRKHYYYREPSTDTHRPCSQAGKLWKADDVDSQVDALLKVMSLDGAWLHHVDELARAGRGRDVGAERRRIETKLERAQEEYLEGRLTKERWAHVFEDCQAELARLIPLDQPLAMAASRLASFAELWEQGSPEARNEICRILFREAVLDFDTRQLTLVPWPEFLPFFDARVHYVAQHSRARG